MSLSLKHAQQILWLLQSGPKSKTELRLGLNWSPWGQNKAIESQLQKMRQAGLVEVKDRKNGIWQLREGVEVCSACEGKGILKLDS